MTALRSLGTNPRATGLNPRKRYGWRTPPAESAHLYTTDTGAERAHLELEATAARLAELNAVTPAPIDTVKEKLAAMRAQITNT